MPYAYRMLLGFKTIVAYNKKINLAPDNFVHCEAAFVVHNSIFHRTLSDVRC